MLTLARDIEAGDIVAAEMAEGVELAQHYAAEALRLDGGSRVSTELRLARRALDWLLQHCPEQAIPLPDLHQRGPGAIRDNKTARQVVTILRGSRVACAHRRGRGDRGRASARGWRIVRGLTIAAFRRFDPYALLAEDREEP